MQILSKKKGTLPEKWKYVPTHILPKCGSYIGTVYATSVTVQTLRKRNKKLTIRRNHAIKMLSFPMFNIPYFFNSRKSCPQKSPVKHWTFFLCSIILFPFTTFDLPIWKIHQFSHLFR